MSELERFKKAVERAHQKLSEEEFWFTVGNYGAIEEDLTGQMLIYTGFTPPDQLSESELEGE